MKRIANQLKTHYDWYVCITRGGLQPCLDLAEITHQTSIDTLCISSYVKDKLNKKCPDLRHEFKNLDHLVNKKVLLIDDIIDSGETLHFAQQYISIHGKPRLLHTAVVYVKPCATINPNFYIELLADNSHVIFPWEIKRLIV